MSSSTRLRRAVSPLRPVLRRGPRMEPGYLVVGTKRGGSTSLADWIARHPEVAPCLSPKGTHYFDVNWRRGDAWFRSAFPKPAPGRKITGEASPYYMFHPLAPGRIAATLPDVKLIVCLRDPVARAWSHHAYEVARGREGLGFEEALDAEAGRLHGEEERLRDQPEYDSPHWRFHAYQRRGHYAEQILELHRAVGAERVLVVQSERLFADPEAELATVWRFLGLAPFVPDDVRPKNANAPYGSMPVHLVARLHEYYRPHNDRLAAVPGVDVWWPGPART
ncbi:MAG: sulfotransferase family protein [Dermatophilaceae bacterium]